MFLFNQFLQGKQNAYNMNREWRSEKINVLCYTFVFMEMYIYRVSVKVLLFICKDRRGQVEGVFVKCMSIS